MVRIHTSLYMSHLRVYELTHTKQILVDPVRTLVALSLLDAQILLRTDIVVRYRLWNM